MTWFVVWVLLSVACGIVLLSLCAVASEADRQMEEELGLIERALEKLQEKRGPSVQTNDLL